MGSIAGENTWVFYSGESRLQGLEREAESVRLEREAESWVREGYES